MKAQWYYVIIIYHCVCVIGNAAKEHIKENLSYNFLANDIIGRAKFQIESYS